MAKRWQEAKAARKGLEPWWNVLRAGFETLYMQNFDLARQGQRAKGAQEDFVSYSEKCLAQVWKPSKCNIRPGKALRQRAKAARRVLGPWWNVLRAGFETL